MVKIPLVSTWLLAATAGSGKTTAAQEYIAAQIQTGRSLRDIAGMSFTRVGSQTLAARVGGSKDDLEYFRTIHAHCYHLLGLKRDEVLTSEQRTQFFRDEVKLPYSSTYTDDIHDWQPPHYGRRIGDTMLAYIEWMRNRMLSIDGDRFMLGKSISQGWPIPLPQHAEYFSSAGILYFLKRYSEYKSKLGVLDFTDMLERVYEEGQPLPVRILVCDEFQDCTTLQNRLVLRWAQHCEGALLLGDVDQLIYEHLGAVPEDFLNAVHENNQLEPLATNYRSGAMIVEHADRLIRRNTGRMQLDVRTAHEGGSIKDYWFIPGILEKLRINHTRSAFVLARTNHRIEQLAIDLEDAGVPFIMRNGTRGIPQNPRSTTFATFAAFRAIVALRSGRQLTPFSLYELAQFVRGEQWFIHGAKAAIKRLAEQDAGRGEILIGLHDLAEHGGTATLVKAIRDDQADLLSRAAPARLRYWRRLARTYNYTVLYETPKIQLSTIHGAKGDEADDVYLLNDITPRVYESMQTRAGLEAERRVFYVAATRARERLIILSGSGLTFDEVLPRRGA